MSALACLCRLWQEILTEFRICDSVQLSRTDFYTKVTASGKYFVDIGSTALSIYAASGSHIRPCFDILSASTHASPSRTCIERSGLGAFSQPILDFTSLKIFSNRSFGRMRYARSCDTYHRRPLWRNSSGNTLKKPSSSRPPNTGEYLLILNS